MFLLQQEWQTALSTEWNEIADVAISWH